MKRTLDPCNEAAAPLLIQSRGEKPQFSLQIYTELHATSHLVIGECQSHDIRAHDLP